MQGKKSFLALSTAFAALFVGCEWTGSADSDSWSGTYDTMNFAGTYRAVTTATQMNDTSSNTETVSDSAFSSAQESGGTFAAGAQVLTGKTSMANIVPGSFQASAGGYAWNDDGNGNLVFTDPNSGASTSGNEGNSVSVVPKSEKVGTLTASNSQKFDLTGTDIVPGSVTVAAGTFTFKDDGAGVLVGSQPTVSGTVNYEAGAITLKFKTADQKGAAVTVTYKYTVSDDTQVVTEKLSGSGTIRYPSGAWTLQINPKMPKASSVIVRYSYYLQNSSSTASYTTIATTTGNDVTALTVSQNGQNLTITLNNGIIMHGRFTNVQQTGRINEDTSAGYNTYNAQFQVSVPDSSMVGTLNYDLQTGFRMLNGTWTWGKNSYDVQARGPAWKNSVDDSTLSVNSITKPTENNTTTSTRYSNANTSANPYANSSQNVNNANAVQNVNPLSNR